MKIISLNEVTYKPSDIAFGASKVAATIAFLAICAFLGLAVYMFATGGIAQVRIPRLFPAFMGLFLLLMALFLAHNLRATLRPANWLLRIQGTDLLIKFRSFENWRMNDSDPQVIVLHRDEIQFARKTVRRQVSSGLDGHGVQATTRVNLEIGLKNADTSAIEKALADEAARPGYGSKRSQTKWLDYPVEVAEGGILRVAWNGGRSDMVRPGIKRALAILATIALVENTQKALEDFTVSALKQLPQDEQKKKLLQLAGRDHLCAVETARRLYGCSIEEAMRIVGGPGSGPTPV